MKKKHFIYFLITFLITLIVSAYITFWPTPAKDIQTFCEIAKMSHIVSEVNKKTLQNTKTYEFFDFFSELSRIDPSLRYRLTLMRAQDFGLKNWECPALKNYGGIVFSKIHAINCTTHSQR